MDFENGVKNIQTAGYNGARTVKELTMGQFKMSFNAVIFKLIKIKWSWFEKRRNSAVRFNLVLG